MLFMFNCLDLRTDVNTLPKFNVVINNVSIYDGMNENDSPENKRVDRDFGLTKEKRVHDIKSQLKEVVKSFYLSNKVSDDIQFGNKPWSILKEQIFYSEEYKEEPWYKELIDD